MTDCDGPWCSNIMRIDIPSFPIIVPGAFSRLNIAQAALSNLKSSFGSLGWDHATQFFSRERDLKNDVQL